MLREPFVQVKEEELFGPEHAGHGLAHDACFILAEMGWSDLSIELVCLSLAHLHDRGKNAERFAMAAGALSLRRRRMVAVFPAPTFN